MSATLPTVRGVVRGNALDVGRFVRWTLDNLLRDFRRRAPWLGPAHLLVAAYFWVLMPGFWLLYLTVSAAQRKAFYFDQEKTAVLGIRLRRSCWFVDDHIAATRGAGQGRALRAALIPAMLTAADQQGITIRALADNKRLAGLYQADVPGLMEGRNRKSGKVELFRPPTDTPL